MKTLCIGCFLLSSCFFVYCMESDDYVNHKDQRMYKSDYGCVQNTWRLCKEYIQNNSQSLDNADKADSKRALDSRCWLGSVRMLSPEELEELQKESTSLDFMLPDFDDSSETDSTEKI